MASTSAAVAGVAADLRGEFQSLAQQATALCSGSWTGQAGAAFAAAWDEFAAGERETVQALDVSAELLASNGQVYGGSDETSRQRCAGVQSAVSGQDYSGLAGRFG